MTFDRLSLPIPEDLLEQSCLFKHRDDRRKKTRAEDDYSRLVEEFEFHSKMATETAKKIQDILNQRKCLPILDSKAKAESDFKIQTITKAFARKPRSIAKLNDEQFITTALDGSIALWNKDQFKMKQLQLPNGYAECITASDRHFYIVGADSLDTGSADNADQVCKIYQYDFDLKLRATVEETKHTKLITCVACLPGGVLCTGSQDRSIVVHAAGGPTILSHHTSAVCSLFPHAASTHLFSAGLDGRLNTIDTHTSRLLSTHKYNSTKFSHLIPAPSHPHLLLASQQTASSDQLLLIDTRTMALLHKFGWPEASNVSRYLKAACRQDHIYCGTQSPADRQSRINMFDIRSLAAQAIGSFNERRWLECCFIENTLVANATDSSLSFISL